VPPREMPADQLQHDVCRDEWHREVCEPRRCRDGLRAGWRTLTAADAFSTVLPVFVNREHPIPSATALAQVTTALRVDMMM
jgi:hypothetical protein